MSYVNIYSQEMWIELLSLSEHTWLSSYLSIFISEG